MFTTNKKSVILFDGICNLCNASVRFIIKRDKKQKFLFASLQSDAATKILLHLKTKKNNLNSIVLIEKGIVYTNSTAALKIARELGLFWQWLYIFIFVTKKIRDSVYRFIAEHRHQWFGKKEYCATDFMANKNRFIS